MSCSPWVHKESDTTEVLNNENKAPGGGVEKNPPASAGDARDMDSIPGSGRSPGVGYGRKLQYSCLEIPWAEDSGGLQSDMTSSLSTIVG